MLGSGSSGCIDGVVQVLGDIEIAQSLQKGTDKKPSVVQGVPHPLDVNYGLLNTALKHLKTDDDEFKVKNVYILLNEVS